jgi:hypothetical protein
MKNRICFGMFFLIVFFSIFCVSADYMRSNTQYTQFDSENTFEGFDESMCEAGQDFIIQIAPFGCTPAVVRSDLLEEQNVPVYCQLGATKINPLIEVEAIESVSFQGEYPEEVLGIGFHPVQAALGTEEDLNHPILNNIGYVIIVLKEQQNASAMPDFVEGNLTAKISYDIKNAFGIGDVSFYLPELRDEEWNNKYNQYGFWGDKGYIRVEDIDEEGATISIYDFSLRKVSSVTLKKGEESEEIYMPGFDCLAGLKIKLENLENPKTRTKLRVEGDVIEVSQGEKFLENKCQIKSLENQGFGEKVSIQCKEDRGNSVLNFEINPKVRLDFDSSSEEGYEIGDWLYDTENSQSVYLGFVGTNGNTGKTSDLYIYLVQMDKKDKLSEEDIFEIYGQVKNNVEKDKIKLLSYSDLEKEIYKKKIKILGFTISQNKELNSETENNYKKAMENYDTILESFSTEKYSDEINYGKKVLSQKIILAGDMEQKETVVELCEEFKQKYSAITSELKEKGYCDNQYKLSSSEDASRSVMINGKLRKIIFEGIYEPSLEDFSINIFVKGMDETYTGPKTLREEDERVYLSKNEFISLKNLEKDYAVFDISSIKGWKENSESSEIKINLKDYKIIGENNYEIRIDGIKLKKTAKVSVIPNINDAGTEANFSFKIGIEKRAIELSPEKIKKTIEDLNETIEQWTNISETLGQAVKGLKTACITTGAVLTVKNLFANAGGKSIARQEVMRGEGGWYEICNDFVSAKEYSSIEECMYKNGDKIDKEVNTFYEVIQEQNKEIKELQKGITKEKFLSEDVVNTSAFMEKYSPQVQKYLEENLGNTIEDPDGKAGSIETDKIIDIVSYNGWKDNKYSLEQLRNIELYTKVLETEPDNKMAQKRLYSSLAEINTNSESYQTALSFDEQLKNKGLTELRNTDSYGNEKTIKGIYDGGTIKGNQLVDLEEDKIYPAKSVTYNNKKYILILDGSGDNYFIQKVYDGETLKPVSLDEEGMIKSAFSGFRKYDRSSYENQYKNYEIRYYETEPYKGLPAVVPFDLNEGWYVATKPTLPIGGNIRAYDESGRVNSFWLCNVGRNGVEEFTSVGDDICEMINKGTGQPYNQFAGLTEDEAIKRIKAGERAIEQASKQYHAGVPSVKIDAGYGNLNIKVGSPAVDISDMQCQDFMSPKDCQLLFNVCDPVICPSSRCDFGGAYPVKDVIQSGIIGSIALCLPNVKEGIIIPVCLTGIQAGIDGLVSISTSYRDCLQESLETGKMIGVCDEIYSVYMCEFLWRQALPLAKIAIPKIMELMIGQDARGGGEYLGVESSWSNAEKSVNYFTQYYGENSYNSFKARSVEEAGGEICKVYVSGVYPEGSNLLDSLTEPDSPPQFHGRFDEIPFTTATVPPTSQYKVFYHIYAGKDVGVYYKVYLKGAKETSFYQDISSSRIVASGYIAAGGYASETKDFTAPSGYQEMCIMVNNQEECGFKQVSTDFAVDYITDKYLEEQTTKTQIKTESECISGSASVYSLLTPNVQEGAGDIINPEIYNRGIIRICATNNPGQGTDAYVGGEDSRWVEVGYCDNEKIKCWLDTESVKEVIKNTEIEGDVLDKVTENQLDILRNKEGYISSDDFKNLKKEIKGLIEDKKYNEAIDKVDESFDFVFLNDEKANLLLLRGDAYGGLATNVKISEDLEEKTFVDDQTFEDSEEKTFVDDQTSEQGIINGVEEEKESCNVYGDLDKDSLEQVSQISDLRQKILKTIEGLEGKVVSVKGTLNCFTSVKYIYDLLDIYLYCSYSDKIGKEYSIGGNKIKVGVDNKEGDIIFKVINPPEKYCKLNIERYPSEVTSKEKLDNIQPGDLLQIVWNKNFGHAVIFVEWVDKEKRIAKLFDWNGPRDVEGKKTYRYYNEILSDTENHPVYVISSPDEEETEFKSSITDKGPGAETPWGEEIIENVFPLISSKYDATKFVTSVLVDKMEVNGIKVSSDLDSFVSELEENKDFVEIDVNKLGAGDIILLGNKCNKNLVGIFESYSSGDIFFYTNLGGAFFNKVDKQQIKFISELNEGNAYIYRAYRYVKGLSDSEKNSIKVKRKKWTVEAALIEIDERLQTDGRENGGTYSDNKKFVDELIFDGILDEKECNDMRGTKWFSWRLGEKNISDLRKILLLKQK